MIAAVVRNPEEVIVSTSGEVPQEPNGTVCPWPSQWITWRAKHVDVDGPDDPQFLRALKGTRRGERQLVLEAESRRGVIGVVDFSGEEARDPETGQYFNWGSTTLLDEPVTERVLEANALLWKQFSNRHGGPKRLPDAAAAELERLLGGFPVRHLPSVDPTERDDLWLWPGVRDRQPEAPIERRFRSERALWKKVGFTVAPTKPFLANGRRPDLFSRVDRLVGDVKNEVRVEWGPEQVEDYLDTVDTTETGPQCWRGILIHEAPTLSHAASERIAASRHADRIEVWTLERSRARWRMRRQFPS